MWVLTQTVPASMRGIRRWTRVRSLLQMLAPRPKALSLARRTASSRLSKGCATTTGPKISSCAMRACCGTSANTVGRTK
ncbi:hypothetical protein D3C78_1820590 [compost metagenome]